MLKKLGFTTVIADSGVEAIRLFKQTPVIVLFVLLDLTMPQMCGEQCFRDLRELDPKVKVIMSSGYNEQEVTEKFVGTALSGFIQKPYNLLRLQDTIRRIL